MTKDEYQANFERLDRLFVETLLNFYVWKGLQQKEQEQIFQKNRYFWNTVLIALENVWLANIAKLYEESSYSKKGEVVSVYALLPHHPDQSRAEQTENLLSQHKRVLKSVQILRQNYLAHNNAKHLRDPKQILQKYPIKYRETEDLLKISGELLSLMHPETGHGYVNDLVIENSQKDAQDIIAKLTYYEQKRKEHWEKFKRGEIDNPNFPPEP